MVKSPHDVLALSRSNAPVPEQLRTLAAHLIFKVDTQSRKIHRYETIIEQLTHEIALLERLKAIEADADDEDEHDEGDDNE